MPFAQVNDVQVFYTDDGEGDPPLLFVHGYTCDSHDWNWQLAYFVDRHRVIAPDIRGHGHSSVPAGGFDAHTFAEDLAGLLDQIGCGPVVAIGHSLGARIVSVLAVEHPEWVRAVVAIDPGYMLSERPAVASGPILDVLDGPDPVGAARSMFDVSSPGLPAALTAWHQRRIASLASHVVRLTLENLGGRSGADSVGPAYLSKRSCPVLAMYADPARAAAEEKLLTDARSRVVSFEGSGHWIHQERPAEVNSIIDGWLATVGGGP